jgi:hypothetical protein
LVREIAASVPIHDFSTPKDDVGYAGERTFEWRLAMRFARSRKGEGSSAAAVPYECRD